MSMFGKRSSADLTQAKKTALVQRTREYSRGPVVERVSRNSSVLPEIHNTHLERLWPVYGALACALFAIFMRYKEMNHIDVNTLLYIGILVGGITYLIFRGFRNSLNTLRDARRIKTQSRAFQIGLVVGLTYWVYSTFVSPTVLLGHEIGVQTAFYDGFQQHDMFAVVQLLLSAAFYGGVSAALFSFFGKRIFKAKKNSETAA